MKTAVGFDGVGAGFSGGDHFKNPGPGSSRSPVTGVCTSTTRGNWRRLAGVILKGPRDVSWGWERCREQLSEREGRCLVQRRRLPSTGHTRISHPPARDPENTGLARAWQWLCTRSSARCPDWLATETVLFQEIYLLGQDPGCHGGARAAF